MEELGNIVSTNDVAVNVNKPKWCFDCMLFPHTVGMKTTQLVQFCFCCWGV